MLLAAKSTPTSWISDRKLAEEALSKCEELLQTVLDSPHDQVFILGNEWKLQFYNKRFAENFQIREKEYLAKQFWEVFSLYNDSLLKQQFQKEKLNLRSAYFEIDDPYSFRTYEISVYPTQEGITVFTTERTEEINAKQAILQLSQALEQSPAIIVMTDIAGNIVYVNPKFTNLIGYSSEEV